ncbi:DUF3995 domain-containing protein [Paenibacillus sp. FSL W7-1287]|uniref:DUF3995 domain-containing protein n=1 Tax=Paenibacillus sp. FSL W7-1287 TaxID=2954538 RepID=UPI0030F53FA8
MIIPIIIFASCILLVISLWHLYWAFGGKRGLGAVLPEHNGNRTLSPGIIATLLVALLVALAALLLLMKAELLPQFMPTMMLNVGIWICAVVFAVRVIGEFNYLGVFKKKRPTLFYKMDTYLYVPLCLFLSIVFLIAAQMGG